MLALTLQALRGLLLPICLGACVSRPSPSDDEFLVRCWDARLVDRSMATYELSFEALLIPATEGGTTSRSRRCPELRLRIAQLPPTEVERFNRIGVSVPIRSLGAGLRGRARVIPVERRSSTLLAVRVTNLLELEQMSERDTQEFIRHFNIG